MSKEVIANWLTSNMKAILEYGGFICVVIIGFLVKIHEAMSNQKKMSLGWLMGELATSFFVAALTYAIFYRYFNCGTFLTLMICAWTGSQSTLIREKSKELTASAFDSAKAYINRKATK